MSNQKNAISMICLGETGTGKTTFINALLGDRLLPVSIRPSTACFCGLSHGQEFSAVYFAGGERRAAPPEKLAEILDLETTPLPPWEMVEITCPALGLKDCQVIDTPPLSLWSAEVWAKVEEYSSRCDFILWFIPADQVGRRADREALQRLGRPERIIGVLNRMDRMEADEGRRALERAKEYFGSLVKEIVPLSARLLYQGRVEDNPEKLAKSGWSVLEKIIRGHF
ncbi:MAG: hypothetical protein PWR22_617 [Moorella sp. (in: firmicutes)]|nr:hypothetical protein [Moorella sp. (in: firmicutes)]